MTDAPVVLGINRTQDASVCLMQGSRLLWAIQKERLTRHKHHWGKPGDVRDLYLPRLPWPERAIDVVVECFSSDEEGKQLPLYEEELAASLRLAPDCRRARISHHLAHVVSVFHPSPFRDAAVMIIDGQGSEAAELTEYWAGAAYVPGDWREVASFYRADRERVLCIGKQLWDRDDARLQTVSDDDDPLLRRLLQGFEMLTGVPVLPNTSFNGKDEPIVETPQEAIASFRRMPLHALVMPSFLVTKRSEPELPA